MVKQEQNQVHPPKPKKVRVDKNGNDRRRLWLKEGTATMLLCEGLTKEGCKILINHINSFLILNGLKAKRQNQFLITK